MRWPEMSEDMIVRQSRRQKKLLSFFIPHHDRGAHLLQQREGTDVVNCDPKSNGPQLQLTYALAVKAFDKGKTICMRLRCLPS